MISILRRYLSEIIYGGIDGAVTTFAVVAGSAGANLGTKTVLILGFANLVADGLSMSIGNYLSVKSEVQQNPDDTRNPILTGGATFFAFQVLGLIPLISYIFTMPLNGDRFVWASIFTAIAFGIIGALKGYFIEQGNIIRHIAETVLLGAIAAFVAYFIGDWLEGLL